MRRFLLLLACAAIVHSWPGAAPAAVIDTVAKVDTLLVIMDGDSTNWSASSTPEWDMIDDVPHDTDGTYIYFSTGSTQTYQMFDVRDFSPEGLIVIDSIALNATHKATSSVTGGKFVWMEKRGATWTDFTDSIGGTGTTYATARYVETTDPITSAAWKYDLLTNSQWGFRKTNNTSNASKYRYVTSAFIEVYWQREEKYDTLDTEIADAYWKSSNITYNWGGDSVLGIGYSNTSTAKLRSMFWLDSTIVTGWENYVVDSAFLDIKSKTVEGGTHNIEIHLSHRDSRPGTAIGSAQSNSSCWRDYKYHADGFWPWYKAGCDSTYQDGGPDRDEDYLDSMAITATGTHTFDVTEWVYLVSRTPRPTADAYVDVALLMRQLSEVSADSQIIFYSRDHATSGNRPVVRVYGHTIAKTAGGVEPPAGESADTITYQASQTYPLRTQVGVLWDSLDQYRRYSTGSRSNDAATFYMGLIKNTISRPNNDWVAGEHWIQMLRFQDVYDTLYQLCLANDISDTAYIDSAVIYLNTNSNVGGSYTSCYAKTSGPVLQWWSLYQWEGIPPVSSPDSVSFTLFQDSCWWGTLGARKRTSGYDGDTSSDYNQVADGSIDRTAGDTSAADVSNLSANDQTRVLWGATTKGRVADVTAMFKVGMLARARDTASAGNSLLDSLGFAVRISFASSTTVDSFAVARSNTWWAVYGPGYTTASVTPALRIYIDADKESVCTAEESAGGQVIIIGQIEPVLGPPRYAHRRFIE